MDRQTKRDWLWIALLGLAVQAFWGLRLFHPSYFDAYYYTINGQQLASGAGFTEPVIWQYLDDPAGVPQPSHTYWMPLTSIIAASGYWLGGSFRGAQLPFWLMAGLLPLLSYTISRRLSPDRWQARTAALFTMAGGYYAAYWVQPTTFALFAWTAGGGLLALALAGREQRAVYWLAAGLLAGLSHLARADGLLLLLVGGAVWLRAAWRARPGVAAEETTRPRRKLLTNALLFGGGYLLIMLPWFYRTWLLTGRFLSTVGTETAFLTRYDDLFAFNRHFTLEAYLAWGLGNILRSKLEAIWLALQTYVAVVGLTAFIFFAIVAWLHYWRRNGRARDLLRPFTWYAILLFLVLTLVFTFPGQRGSMLHSSTALWPWSMTLAAAGVGISVDWIAGRRRNWRAATARRFFGVTFTLLIFLITLVVSGEQPLRRDQARLYQEIAAQLPAGAIVMVGSPPDFYYHTGYNAIVVPNEPPPGMLAAAQHFGAEYLILDVDRPAPLAALYEGTTVPGVTLLREYDLGLRLYRLAPEERP